MAIDRWNGNGDWRANPTNWSLGTPPASGDTAIIDSGTATLGTSESASVAALTVVAGSGVTLGNGAALTTTAGLHNNGNLNVTGNGAAVTVGAKLANAGNTYIGSTGLSASTSVTAAGLSNSGSLTVQGNAASGTTNQATLDITGAVPATVTGSIRILGDADLQIANQLTTIGTGAFFQIDGAQARVTIGNTTTSAIQGLALNDGLANFDGNCSLGAGGSSITTTTNFTNNGTLWVDYYGGDGATSVTFGGKLINYGLAIIGNTSLGANAGPNVPTTVTAAGFANHGSVVVQGNASSGATNETVLDITSTSAASATGYLRVGGYADVALVSKITAIGAGGWLELDGAQASISLGAGATSTALASLSANYGTYVLRGGSAYGAGGASVSATTGLNNAGALSVDAYGGDGGSTLSLGAALTNSGSVVIGNTSLRASTHVIAGGLANNGTLALQGNVSSGTSNQAVLDITKASSTTATGYTRVGGDANLQLVSKITAVGAGAWLELDGAQASISLGAGATSTALASLSANYGTYVLRGGSAYGAGGASVSATTGLNNAGALSVDAYGGDGGSTLSLGGALTNSGSVAIGNTSLRASTHVIAGGLANNGTLALQGNVSSGTSNQAVLDITKASSTTATGYTRVGGDANLQLVSKITAVGAGAWLELDGAQASISLGAGATSTALASLSANYGTYVLRGDSAYGAGGASVSATTGLNNADILSVDAYGGDGGSTLSLGGALTNSGSVAIGNNSLSASTTVTAGGLTNNGTLALQGNVSSGTSNQAVLDITKATATTATGYTRVGGDANLQLTSAITAVSAGAWLELDGAGASISLGAGATSTALASLKSNAGTLVLRGGSAYGAGGVVVSATTALNNTGALSVDAYGGDGGSSLTFGGALTNSGSVVIGNTNLSASTTVTAGGLTNNGTLALQGNASIGSSNAAVLDITKATATTATGFTRVGGNADLQLTSKITAVSAGAWLELDGAHASISLGAGATSTAITNLSTVDGTLLLRGNSNLGGGGVALTTTTAMSNTGSLLVDLFGGDGASSITLGGALTNQGSFDLGNTNLSAADTLTASGLTNNGALSIYGGNSNLADMIVHGTATNTGHVTIGNSAELDVTGTGGYTQNSGTTTVSGLLAAGTIAINGGLADFTSAVTSAATGTFDIGSNGTLEFGAAVGSNQQVTFTDTTGTLSLGSPGSFAGVINGFSGSDAIDLLHQSVTGLSYAGSATSGTLTVTGSSGTIATLAFNGDYTTSSFSTISDGSGGTEIVDPPSNSGGGSPGPALAAARMTFMSLTDSSGAGSHTHTGGTGHFADIFAGLLDGGGQGMANLVASDVAWPAAEPVVTGGAVQFLSLLSNDHLNFSLPTFLGHH